MMRRWLVGFAALALTVTAVGAYAVQDPIQTRKVLMDANGAAAGAAVGMIKGDIPFNPAVARSALQTMRAVAYTYGDYFPAGSDKGNTKASPKIWEDAAGFAAALAKFQKDTDAAVAAKPQDLDAFKGVFGDVADNCQTCHDNFRLSSN